MPVKGIDSQRLQMNEPAATNARKRSPCVARLRERGYQRDC